MWMFWRCYNPFKGKKKLACITSLMTIIFMFTFPNFKNHGCPHICFDTRTIADGYWCFFFLWAIFRNNTFLWDCYSFSEKDQVSKFVNDNLFFFLIHASLRAPRLVHRMPTIYIVLLYLFEFHIWVLVSISLTTRPDSWLQVYKW